MSESKATPSGWEKDMDEVQTARAANGGRTAAPWHWEIHDYSAATLCGGHANADANIGHVLTIGPCEACAERRKETGWQWGACMTPSEADANLIAAAPDMLAALKAQHDAIDTLFAMLIERDRAFRPTESGVWPNMVQGFEAIKRAEGKP